jgi:hypothetical protein
VTRELEANLGKYLRDTVTRVSPSMARWLVHDATCTDRSTYIAMSELLGQRVTPCDAITPMHTRRREESGTGPAESEPLFDVTVSESTW